MLRGSRSRDGLSKPPGELTKNGRAQLEESRNGCIYRRKYRSAPKRVRKPIGLKFFEELQDVGLPRSPARASCVMIDHTFVMVAGQAPKTVEFAGNFLKK